MEISRFFVYSWYTDPEEEEITSIRMYGLGENNQNICLRVDDFTPYIYLELPTTIKWSDTIAQILGNKIDELLGHRKPLKKVLVMKKRLYKAYLDSNGERLLFPYLFCAFSSKADIRMLSYKIRKPILVPGVGGITLKIHEMDASPELQISCCRKIQTAGWVQFRGKRVKNEEEKVTLCDEEWIVKYKNLQSYTTDQMPRPKVMAFDIEANSHVPSMMPRAYKPQDCIFQISCVFGRIGDDPRDYVKYLLTLGQPSQEFIGQDTNIFMYDDEMDMLEGYAELIQEENPNIIAGYNILGFDIDYMIGRANLHNALCRFNKQGFHKFASATQKKIKWSSSAYKNQEFNYLDAEGRIFIDLLPLVRRDFKMSNYKLKTISTYFLGETKDPLSVKGIFKCYRIGIKKNRLGEYSPKAQKAMSIVGKYCIQDSFLILQLMEKLQTWVGLTEMASTCNVQIFTLYTQGQQIKVYSQLYRYCIDENIVVESNAYQVADTERYIGAHVFPPIPGVYDDVVSFDFCSLYPTTIMAYNIDYHTWVPDDSDIPDSMCHVMEWEDHLSCVHDSKMIRKKELDEYIKKKEDELKSMREKKKKMLLTTIISQYNCTRKEAKEIRDNERNDLTKYIEDEVEGLKPYKKERADINKTKSKFPMCEKRRYRFLKEPRGVLPTIIENLLNARKHTRKVDMTNVKQKIEELKAEQSDKVDNSEKIKELNSLLGVLDKRQLAYKVSANSMYGIMGTRKGYLPFMAGAMCLDGDSNISLPYGFTRKLKDLTDTNFLWSYENNTQIISHGNGVKYNGKKEVIKLTLLDGRTLRCTSDHKIMTTDGWIEAGKLLNKHNWDGNSLSINNTCSKIMIGLELPEDIIEDNEEKWDLLSYTMNTPNNREKTLAFCRILGFILANGSISKYKNKFNKELVNCTASLGNLLDVQIFAQDIKLISEKEPKITNCEQADKKGNTFCVHLPKLLIDQILLLENIPIGKRSYQPYMLPSFLFEENCPLSVIREFLGGLFGGDGCSPSLSIANPSFSPIKLQLTTIEKYKENMSGTMNKLVLLLEKFGIKFRTSSPKLTRRREDLLPKDIDENPRWEYIISTNSCNNLLFAQKIGFRYCLDKSNKLTIAASYQRYSDNVRKQYINLILSASEIYDSDGNITINGALKKARTKLYENETPLHKSISIGKSSEVYNHRSQPHCLNNYKLLQKFFINARDYTKITGCEHWFSENKMSKKVYSMNRMDISSPCLYIDLVDIRPDGIIDVYDIIDVPNQSFLSNGMVVHNCTTYMGRTNIEKVAHVITTKFGGELVYGDTDSNYVHFPQFEGKPKSELWDYSIYVADEITKMFPRPIALSFEDSVYSFFFILTKKRYMYIDCDRDGNLSSKIGKKGVLLARRDNSAFVRNIYEYVITEISKGTARDDILYYVLHAINKLFSKQFASSEFVITKAVGGYGDLTAESCVNQKGHPRAKVGDYMLPLLSTNIQTREEQLKKKGAANSREFYMLSLPAQVQLAIRMKERGQRVEPGERLEYLVTDIDNHTGKQYAKVESIDYYNQFSSVLTIDYFYYLKALATPLDQVLNVAFGKDKDFKEDFVMTQYKFCYNVRRKVLKELKQLFQPKIVFDAEITENDSDSYVDVI